METHKFAGKGYHGPLCPLLTLVNILQTNKINNVLCLSSEHKENCFNEKKNNTKR